MHVQTDIMKPFNFSRALRHIVAVVVFFLVTIIFFSPVFFNNKSINQGDINQFLWGSKELRDYRAATGEEGLWTNSMFSGMPAYLVNLDWSDGAITGMKRVLALFLPHPVANVFLAFVCYYILLLTFRIRPYLAIAGALAFGLTSYMIIGLSAGHNARIGAIAFMPLVMAGIHLAFSRKLLLGFAVTAAGLALHLRENHAQITYYLVLIVGFYGLVQLAQAFREKQLKVFGQTVGVLACAAVLAAATFFGPLWAISEYSRYSTRGKSELITTSANTAGSGLPKSYAFEYSNGILEPITALIPDFYGGSSSHALVNDQNSETYQALVAARDQNLANQLAQYSSSYWGSQPLSAPYYGGAIIVFLFVLGLLTAERKYVIWLATTVGFGVVLSWGSNFEAVNYFLFDHLPGLNKFRSVTFSLIMVFFSMPLLGMLALEKYFQAETMMAFKRKLLIAFGITGGLCLLLLLFAGLFSFSRSIESNLPAWFANVLHADRKAMMRSDAFRSLAFIFSIFMLLYLNVPRKISAVGFFAFLSFMVAMDMIVVDKRYFTKDNYQRKRENGLVATPSDESIRQDQSIYRVLNLRGFYEAGTSNFHHSLGGYHGVRIKRYQELFDSCIIREQDQFISDAQQGRLNFSRYNVLNMLNTKYFLYGDRSTDYIQNPLACGNAWFVKELAVVPNPNEELSRVSQVNPRHVAVMDKSKFATDQLKLNTDSLAHIRLLEQRPPYLKYESESATGGLAVFSEIFYPKGWHALVDGKESPILRADYVLRALEIPAGKHVVEFKFEPKPYIIGNTITLVAGWALLLIVLGSLWWSWKEEG